MTHTNIIYRITNTLSQKILDKFDTYRKRKTQQAKECCRRYEIGHKSFSKLQHKEITSFNAKFFDDLD